LSTIITRYLDDVKSNLRLETRKENEVISELATHIEDEVQELQQKGVTEEEAAGICVRLLGSAKAVARLIYEAHSQGSWQQALMASLPHLLFGLVFILNWFKGIVPVLIVLLVILAVTVYGWWRRQSMWLFTWLGYSMLPVIAAGLSLLYLPRGLAWVAVLVYVPLALWLMIRVFKQTIKKDWLHLSLMLLPMPVIISWFIIAQRNGNLDGNMLDRLSYYGPSIGASFMALAFGVITFIRIRSRWLKIAVLFFTGMITLSLIWYYTSGQLTFVGMLLLLLLTCSIFLIPAWLENGVRSGRWGKTFLHRLGT
jgi:hypothetical protein